MTDETMVGIDLGTSGVRVAAYDAGGSVLAAGSADLRAQTTDAWLDALARAAPPDLPEDPSVLAVDSTSGTVVPVDRTGEAVCDPLMYHETAPEQGDRLADTAAVRELADRGVTLGPTAPLAKLARLRERRPGAFGAARWFLDPAAWLTYRLRHPAGEPWRDLRTDWTNARKFGADVLDREPTWFEPAFEAAGVPVDRLPSVAAPGARVGPAASDLAESLGLAGAPLHLGVTDGNASALAMGCLSPGDCGVACGSTSVLKLVTAEYEPREALYYHRHPVEGYLAGAAFESGSLVEWVCDRLLGLPVAEALELAAVAPADAAPRFYPPGTRSPFFDAGMDAALAGLDADPDRSRAAARGGLVRGLATGVALAEGSYLPTFDDLVGGVERVRLLGGGGASEDGTDDGADGGSDDDGAYAWWDRLRAAVWDRPVVRVAPRTTAGAVVPAAIEAGVYPDAATARDRLVREVGPVEPACDPAAFAAERADYRERWAATGRL